MKSLSCNDHFQQLIEISENLSMAESEKAFSNDVCKEDEDEIENMKVKLKKPLNLE